jgi:hypothetical protein
VPVGVAGPVGEDAPVDDVPHPTEARRRNIVTAFESQETLKRGEPVDRVMNDLPFASSRRIQDASAKRNGCAELQIRYSRGFREPAGWLARHKRVAQTPTDHHSIAFDAIAWGHAYFFSKTLM